MRSPQIVASDPKVSAFVTANAGSGKTRTLVDRVARLLLRGADPASILCVTYTKAAAAEMQRRLYDTLGGWAVMPDAKLKTELARIEERPDDFVRARELFARALETPGGLKIQTLHAFCEKLLKRFPLEAGIAPGFEVLEDQAARELSARARDDVARAALAGDNDKLSEAYERFSEDLAHRFFLEMFAAFEAQRAEIKAYVDACADGIGVEADVWARCGFRAPGDSLAIEREAVGGTDWPALKRAARALLAGSANDQGLGAALLALAERETRFDELWALFCTKDGKPLARVATAKVDPGARAWLAGEQQRLGEACARIKAARVAEDSVKALYLASAYGRLYGGLKDAQGGLDFGDLIGRTHRLLTGGEGAAAWVLYKLDEGIEHLLVDEAQDTSPEQWDILDILTDEFFVGAGAHALERTAFAVGDEKQSIFSFQGAEPARFKAERERARALVESAGRPFRSPELLESFRSTPEVLGFVDTVFDEPQALPALRPGDDVRPVRHVARRDPGFGAVDLWPLERSDPQLDANAWDAPVDAEPPSSGNKKLARRIAREIRAMVEGGVATEDRDRKRRALSYGDVMILVRRRGALFHEIIRALKLAKVPVGGADRLTLSEHIVFHDLLAVARFCLYPTDDLNLAALLRSPFCDVDEGGLYDLAQARTGSLWGELKRRSGERPEWTAAVELLEALRGEARSRGPFDLYARLLNRTDAQGRSLRSRLVTRLGREADEALDAFLGEALKAERRGVRELETFAADMAAVEVEVKREQDEGQGEVRVMTVHGAKGLEAPVVILPDTATRATVQGGPLLSDEGGFLWSARKADDCEASAAMRQARSDKADQESLRLLYVALTRARDRLIVCGVEPGRAGLKSGSWYDYIERGLGRLEPDVRRLETLDGPIRRLGADPVRAPTPPWRLPLEPQAPPWLTLPAPPESPLQRYAAPSQLGETTTVAASPLAAAEGGLGRYRRGDLIHRLLQLLPDVAPARRRAAGAAILAKERDLTPAQREEMLAAAMGVLQDDRFAAVFGPASRAEAAIAGTAPELPDGLPVSGRIDRLVVEADRVLVADFKTNRPSPERIEDADGAYITQMAVYAAVLRQLFPGRRVEAALIWTDGPKLMDVPENLMAQALEALPRSG